MSSEPQLREEQTLNVTAEKTPTSASVAMVPKETYMMKANLQAVPSIVPVPLMKSKEVIQFHPPTPVQTQAPVSFDFQETKQNVTSSLEKIVDFQSSQNGFGDFNGVSTIERSAEKAEESKHQTLINGSTETNVDISVTEQQKQESATKVDNQQSIGSIETQNDLLNNQQQDSSIAKVEPIVIPVSLSPGSTSPDLKNEISSSEEKKEITLEASVTLSRSTETDVSSVNTVIDVPVDILSKDSTNTAEEHQNVETIDSSKEIPLIIPVEVLKDEDKPVIALNDSNEEPKAEQSQSIEVQFEEDSTISKTEVNSSIEEKMEKVDVQQLGLGDKGDLGDKPSSENTLIIGGIVEQSGTHQFIVSGIMTSPVPREVKTDSDLNNLPKDASDIEKTVQNSPLELPSKADLADFCMLIGGIVSEGEKNFGLIGGLVANPLILEPKDVEILENKIEIPVLACELTAKPETKLDDLPRNETQESPLPASLTDGVLEQEKKVENLVSTEKPAAKEVDATKSEEPKVEADKPKDEDDEIPERPRSSADLIAAAQAAAAELAALSQAAENELLLMRKSESRKESLIEQNNETGRPRVDSFSENSAQNSTALEITPPNSLAEPPVPDLPLDQKSAAPISAEADALKATIETTANEEPRTVPEINVIVENKTAEESERKEAEGTMIEVVVTQSFNSNSEANVEKPKDDGSVKEIETMTQIEIKVEEIGQASNESQQIAVIILDENKKSDGLEGESQSQTKDNEESKTETEISCGLIVDLKHTSPPDHHELPFEFQPPTDPSPAGEVKKEDQIDQQNLDDTSKTLEDNSRLTESKDEEKKAEIQQPSEEKLQDQKNDDQNIMKPSEDKPLADLNEDGAKKLQESQNKEKKDLLTEAAKVEETSTESKKSDEPASIPVAILEAKETTTEPVVPSDTPQQSSAEVQPLEVKPQAIPEISVEGLEKDKSTEDAKVQGTESTKLGEENEKSKEEPPTQPPVEQSSAPITQPEVISVEPSREVSQQSTKPEPSHSVPQPEVKEAANIQWIGEDPSSPKTWIDKAGKSKSEQGVQTSPQPIPEIAKEEPNKPEEEVKSTQELTSTVDLKEDKVNEQNVEQNQKVEQPEEKNTELQVNSQDNQALKNESQKVEENVEKKVEIPEKSAEEETLKRENQNETKVEAIPMVEEPKTEPLVNNKEEEAKKAEESPKPIEPVQTQSTTIIPEQKAPVAEPTKTVDDGIEWICDDTLPNKASNVEAPNKPPEVESPKSSVPEPQPVPKVEETRKSEVPPITVEEPAKQLSSQPETAQVTKAESLEGGSVQASSNEQKVETKQDSNTTQAFQVPPISTKIEEANEVKPPQPLVTEPVVDAHLQNGVQETAPSPGSPQISTSEAQPTSRKDDSSVSFDIDQYERRMSEKNEEMKALVDRLVDKSQEAQRNSEQLAKRAAEMASNETPQSQPKKRVSFDAVSFGPIGGGLPSHVESVILGKGILTQPTGVDILPDGNVLVTDKQKGIFIFSIDGSIVKQVENENWKDPCAPYIHRTYILLVQAVRNGEGIWERMICKFSFDLNLLARIECPMWIKENMPVVVGERLCVSPAENIYLAVNADKFTGLYELTPGGQWTELEYKLDERFIDICAFSIVPPVTQILVVEGRKNYIHMYSIINSQVAERRRMGVVKRPGAITQDEEGNLFVLNKAAAGIFTVDTFSWCAHKAVTIVDQLITHFACRRGLIAVPLKDSVRLQKYNIQK